MIEFLPKPVFAIDAVTFTIKALAVVGGAVIGGLAISGLTGLFARFITAKKIPTQGRWVVRSLGGVASGWIVALFLFGGGDGWGLGGPGGLGLGGAGSGPGNTTKGEPPDKNTAENKKSGNPLSSPTSELRIEVIGDPALERLGPAGKLDAAHCYRIEGEEPPKLRNLAELKRLINERLGQEPPLKRIELVLYTDSPGRRVKRVADLEEWLDDLIASKKDPSLSYNVNDKVPIEAPVR